MNGTTRNGSRYAASLVLSMLGMAVASCSSSTPPPSATGDAGVGATDAGATGDAGGAVAAGCTAAAPVSLTVKNALSWCNVTVGANAASSAASQTVCVAAGAVNLSATPLTGFELGNDPWHDTAGDTGSGDPGTLTGAASATTVTVTSGTKCVWVCCPFPDGSGCPKTDQCP